jgi:uncharacterized protein
MKLPLMPKATAVWLINNTTLTFEQIATFCGMHILEVQGIADDEVATGIIGQNPIISNQLTHEEIKRCEHDPKATLQLAFNLASQAQQKKKSTRYTPIARRQDKPDAIFWLLRNCPGVTDSQIIKLIGTTHNTIMAIRNKLHWNMSNIRPKDPVLLGLCTQTAVDHLINSLSKQINNIDAHSSEVIKNPKH